MRIIKKVVPKAVETKLEAEKNTLKKPWITKKIVDLINERRRYTNGKMLKIKENTKHIENQL